MTQEQLHIELQNSPIAVLERYAAGKLSPEQAQLVEIFLAENPLYADALEGLNSLSGAAPAHAAADELRLRSRRLLDSRKVRPLRRPLTLYATAAAAVLLVVGTSAMLLVQRAARLEERPAARMAPLASAEQAAENEAQTPATPAPEAQAPGPKTVETKALSTTEAAKKPAPIAYSPVPGQPALGEADIRAYREALLKQQEDFAQRQRAEEVGRQRAGNYAADDLDDSKKEDIQPARPSAATAPAGAQPPASVEDEALSEDRRQESVALQEVQIVSRSKRSKQMKADPANTPAGQALETGLYYFRAGQYNEALPWLEQAAAETAGAQRDEAQWYLANAYANSSRSKAARRLLEQLAAREGNYQHHAAELLKTLK